MNSFKLIRFEIFHPGYQQNEYFRSFFFQFLVAMQLESKNFKTT